eukprot:11210782-Lingulodinium_polyedra.AAC.1
MVPLPHVATEWLLDVDSEGAMVVEVSDQDPVRFLDVDRLLHHKLFSREGGDTTLIESKGCASPGLHSLREALAQHARVTLSLRSSSSGSWDILEAAVFLLPRGGCRAQFTLAAVLRLLGTERSKKTLGRYITHQFPAWQRAVAGWGLPGLLLGAPWQGEEDCPGDGHRVLDFKAADAPCILLLLTKWAFAVRQACGLSNAKEKHAAEDLLQRLLAL